jgi:hypothetical protein
MYGLQYLITRLRHFDDRICTLCSSPDDNDDESIDFTQEKCRGFVEPVYCEK